MFQAVLNFDKEQSIFYSKIFDNSFINSVFSIGLSRSKHWFNINFYDLNNKDKGCLRTISYEIICL
jgi:hypothetical protein